MDRRRGGFRRFPRGRGQNANLRNVQRTIYSRRSSRRRSQHRSQSQRSGNAGRSQTDFLVVEKYKQMYPGYEKFYCNLQPTIREFEEKVKNVQLYLHRCGFIREQLAKDLDLEEYKVINYQIKVEDIAPAVWGAFAGELKDEGEEVVSLWNLAAYTAVYEKLKEKAGSDYANSNCPRYSIGFELTAVPPTPVPELKAPLLGRYIGVTGIVIKSSSVQPFFETMCFRCILCKEEFAIKLRESHFTHPSQCPNTECNNKKPVFFEIAEHSPKTLRTDCKKIQIRDYETMGVNAKAVDCLILGDPASHGMVGDMITVYGILKMYVDSEKNTEISIHDMYIHVTAIHRHNQEDRQLASKAYEFSDDDRNEIRKIMEHQDLLKLFVHSLAPSVFGNLVVKAGLVLALFGGSDKNSTSGVSSTRPQIHILLCGSPGISKSTLLKRVVEVAPHAAYSCMTSTSACGISVSMSKDAGGYSVDSGLLVNYSGSVVCLDEIDKAASAQHAVLLESMESETITISKCGVCQSYPAKCTIIAAGNPASGRYDRSKTVVQNLKISKPLFTRFDLVYILGDEHNQEFDRMLVEHRKARATDQYEPAMNFVQRHLQSHPTNEDLSSRLALERHEEMELLTTKQMQIYIAYAKKFIHPVLTHQAKLILKEYFMELRGDFNAEGEPPTSVRILESLIRMAQAMARLEMKRFVNEDHAMKVVEISKASKPAITDYNRGYDEEELARPSSIPASRMRGVNTEAKTLVGALHNVARKTHKVLFSFDEIKDIAAALKLGRPASSLIDVLNMEGFLIQRSNRTYKLLNID